MGKSKSAPQFNDNQCKRYKHNISFHERYILYTFLIDYNTFSEKKSNI